MSVHEAGELLAKNISQLSVSSSNLAVNGSGDKKNLPSAQSCATLSIVVNSVDVSGVGNGNGNNAINLSKSMNSLSQKDQAGDDTSNEFKLKSPYGDYCAFKGGAGSGGCIFTGPYEPMIIPKDDYTDESFESTEESDATIDHDGPDGVTHNDFKNTEIVWVKRPSQPWFPGIIIDPCHITKDIKELMKHVGISMPHKDQINDYSMVNRTFHESEKLFFVCLFNRKKTWLWVTESKLRPFCKENDRLFLEATPILSTKYRRELEKAYKKAKRFCKTSSFNNLAND